MQIQSIHLHNFRSIKDSKFDLNDYSILVGENNAGKTNIINAIRIFYEDKGIKYSEKEDFPKFNSQDNESWIEIEYLTTDAEQESLKKEYRNSNNILKVRKYLKSDNRDLVKANQSNIYAYENGKLSTNLFYGAKNISQAKLGRIIFIPEISTTDENFKLSGPSPFRDTINFVMKKVVKGSSSFNNLESSFEKFNKDFREESTQDGFSMKKLIEDFNEGISNWEVKFGIDINPVRPEDIVKNLLSHHFIDNNFKGERISLGSFGQGLQRHLIYTLIKISAQYADKTTSAKKDFSPDLTFILFEEPEAFLHPSQQEQLNASLRLLSGYEEQQVLITTHSPIFVSKNINDIGSLISIKKKDGISEIYQLLKDQITFLFDNNLSLFKLFSDLLNDQNITENIKNNIRSRKLGDPDADADQKLEEESLKYCLWLDGERAAAFFARLVIICEGASEKALLDYLSNNKWDDFKNKHIYFLDAMGKFNIHRYMNLFGKLGIHHSILYDKDRDANIQGFINDFLEKNKNEFTKSSYNFDTDIEDFLKIDKPKGRNDLKPLNIMCNYQNGNISDEDIEKLKQIVESLI